MRLEASGPGVLVRGLVRSAAGGRYGELWDAVEPGQQRLVARALFESCLRRMVAGAAVPLADIPVTVVAVRSRPQSTEVEVRAAAPFGPVNRTLQTVMVEGRWRWLLPPSILGPLRAGRCPAA